MTFFTDALQQLRAELEQIAVRTDRQTDQGVWIAQLLDLTRQAMDGRLSQPQWLHQAGPLMVGLGKADVTFDQRHQQSLFQINIGSLTLTQPFRQRSVAPAVLAQAELLYRNRIKARFGPEAGYYIPLAAHTHQALEKAKDDSCADRSMRRRRVRATAEYCEWILAEREIRKVQLNDLKEGVDKYPCVILLGEPGCGKTTVLEHLAFELSDDKPRLPLLLRLSEFTPGMRVEDFIVRCWAGSERSGHWACPELAANLQTYLSAGRLFLMFDALNECPREQYSQRVAALRRLIDQWTPQDNRFVVSCRVLDYGQELSGLQRIEIQPLDDSKIKAFIQNELPKTWPQLWAKLTEEELPQRSLLEMARNPYILTMIIDIYAEQGRLGKNRAEMLQLFTETLFKWAKGKCEPEKWLPEEIQKEALAHLAFEMQARTGSGTMVETILAKTVMPENMQPDPAWPPVPSPSDQVLDLAAKAHVIEMPVNRSSVRFYHQLLQEYFSARRMLGTAPAAMVDRWRWPWLEKELPLWIRPEGNWDPLPPPPPTGWEETTILAAGLAPENDDQLVRALVQINPVLAGRCLHEGRARVAPQIRQDVVEHLIKTIENQRVALRVRIAAGKVLGFIGDPRIGQMVCVKAGKFIMGDDSIIVSAPQHELDLPDYLIGKYPVTNSEFSMFINAGGYAQKKWWCAPGWVRRKDHGWQNPRSWDDDRFNSPNQPVVGISWYEAEAYCRWLAFEHGKPFLLPSEAQWEKAARGRDGRVYPWGERFLSEAANCDEGSQAVRATTPVGIDLAGVSPCGCLDMAGNVFEWTRSLWGEEWNEPDFQYPYDPDDGRENADAGVKVLRVLRGGAWDVGRYFARCASRSGDSPYYWFEDLGFRVAVSPISGL